MILSAYCMTKTRSELIRKKGEGDQSCRFFLEHQDVLTMAALWLLLPATFVPGEWTAAAATFLVAV